MQDPSPDAPTTEDHTITVKLPAGFGPPMFGVVALNPQAQTYVLLPISDAPDLALHMAQAMLNFAANHAKVDLEKIRREKQGAIIAPPSGFILPPYGGHGHA